MEQRREQKHDFIDVKNESLWRVNSKQIESRKPNPLSSLYNR